MYSSALWARSMLPGPNTAVEIPASQKCPAFFQLDKVAQMGLEAGILSQAEADKLAAVEKDRLDVINVDDFDPADLLAGKAARNSKAKAKKADAA